MKTSNIIIGISLLAMAACAPNNQFTLSGSVEGECDSVYFFGDRSDLLSVAVPVVDGRYQWTGTVDSVINIWVCNDRQQSHYCRAILEPGDIVLDIPAEGIENALPSGTPLNDSIATFRRKYDELSKQYNAIDKRMFRWLEFEEYVKKPVKNGQLSLDLLSAEVRDSLEHDITAEYSKLVGQSTEVYSEYMNLMVNSLCQNDDNAYGVYLLESYNNGFCDRSFWEQCELVEESVMKLRKLFPNNSWTEYVGGRLEGMMRTTVGRKYTNLTMPTPEEGELSLSDIIPANKYTFIDFWASWCGPCRAELPNVKAAYAKYHAQGFEVVGVSFDANEEAWKKAIAEEDLPWLHMSDLKGWECAASDVYGIKAIPFTMLVAQDGTIVAKNLRGDELMKKLDELMGK